MPRGCVCVLPEQVRAIQAGCGLARVCEAVSYTFSNCFVKDVLIKKKVCKDSEWSLRDSKQVFSQYLRVNSALAVGLGIAQRADGRRVRVCDLRLKKTTVFSIFGIHIWNLWIHIINS
jgi:hypothetical protein